MARPDYAAMKAEVTKRLGNHGYTGFSTRVEYWLNAALYWAATAWHHPELDEVNNDFILATSTSAAPCPSDIGIPVSVALLKPGTTTVDSWLKVRDFHVIQAHFDETNGKPRLYARYGDEIYVERNANANYPIRYYYTKLPALPDYTSGTSPLSEVFDEILMGKAVCTGYANLWRPDLSVLHERHLQTLLEAVPNRRIFDDATADRSTRSKRDQSLMGVQG